MPKISNKKTGQFALVTEIVPEGKSGIAGRLWKGRRNGKFGEGVIVKEQRIQILTQGVVCGKFDAEQVLTGSDLIAVYIKVSDNCKVIAERYIGLKVQIAFQPLFFTAYFGHYLYVLKSIAQAYGIFGSIYFRK